MRRIAVIGTTGSGKTTLARELSQRLRIPLIEEDAILWKPSWTEAPRAVRLERITEALRGEAWVVDGNMFSLGHPNLRSADTVIWLDLPLSVTWWRLLLRTFRRIVTREELWAGNRQTLRKALFDRDSILWYALRTYRKRREAYAALFARSEYTHLAVIHLRSPQDVQAWLSLVPGVFHHCFRSR